MKFDLDFFLKRQWGSIVLLLACIFISLALSDIPFLVSNYSTHSVQIEGVQNKLQLRGQNAPQAYASKLAAQASQLAAVKTQNAKKNSQNLFNDSRAKVAHNASKYINPNREGN
jgi:hypothetical protein